MVAACPFPCARGTPIRIQRMAEALAGRGHAVHVVTYHLGGPPPHPSVRVHRSPAVPTYRKESPGPSLQKLALVDPLLTMRLAGVLRRHRVDLVHAHHYEGLLAARAVACWSGHPVIYDAHTLLESELSHYLPRPLRRTAIRMGAWLDATLPRGVAHIVAVSATIRDKVIASGAAPAERVSVIGNGVEQGHFETASKSGSRGRDFQTLIFTGNLARYQGIELLLQAFGRIHARREDVRLVIVTDTPFDPYEQLAGELGVRGAIDVVGGTFETLPSQLAGAAVALNPRVRCDGVPLKLLNYMSAAKPIVSFEGSGHSLEHERTGRLVPDGDTAAFAQAVVDLLENPEAAQRLGQNARQYSRDHFSWFRAAEQLESVYERVLGAKSSTDLPCTPLPGPAGILA